MAKFIKLTNTDESDIFINVEQIQTITKDENDTAIQFEDGTKKTLGVILPTEQALTFETHVPERMEVISGECRVHIADSTESELFRAGQSFYVPGNSRFRIETDDVLDYVCHLEG